MTSAFFYPLFANVKWGNFHSLISVGPCSCRLRDGSNVRSRVERLSGELRKHPSHGRSRLPPAGALGDALNTGMTRNTSSTVMQNSPLQQYATVTAGDYSRSGDPVKQFSIGVVDETAGDLTPSNSNFSSQRSRSNTPSTVSVGIPSLYFPSAASYGSFELLAPQELAKNVGMENLFSDEDSNVPFSIRFVS